MVLNVTDLRYLKVQVVSHFREMISTVVGRGKNFKMIITEVLIEKVNLSSTTIYNHIFYDFDLGFGWLIAVVLVIIQLGC